MEKQHVIEIKKTASEMDDAKFQLRQILQNNQIDSLKDTHGAQLERLAHNKVFFLNIFSFLNEFKIRRN